MKLNSNLSMFQRRHDSQYDEECEEIDIEQRRLDADKLETLEEDDADRRRMDLSFEEGGRF